MFQNPPWTYPPPIPPAPSLIPLTWVSRLHSLHRFWMFYSSLALIISFPGVTGGFHPGGSASVMRILQLADKHPCQTSFAALTPMWKVFYFFFLLPHVFTRSPRLHFLYPKCICINRFDWLWDLKAQIVILFLHRLHVHVNMVVGELESHTNMKMMWSKVKEQSDWKAALEPSSKFWPWSC